MLNAKNYFDNYQKNIEILDNPQLDQKNLFENARKYAKGVADASVKALNFPIREIATPELFNKVRGKGIELYRECYLRGEWVRKYPLPDSAFRILTVALDKIYSSLSESDRINVNKQLEQDIKKYEGVMSGFFDHIKKVFIPLALVSRYPSYFYAENVKMLNDWVKKFDEDSASNRSNIILGQSLAVISAMNVLRGSPKQYRLFPFSKGNTFKASTQYLSPESIQNFLIGAERELVVSENATALERYVFGLMVDEFKLKSGDFTLFDQVESIASMQSLLSFFRSAEVDDSKIRYVWQVFDEKTCPQWVNMYRSSDLYSKLQDRVVIFNKINCENKKEQELVAKIVARTGERNRLVPPMAPEQWLFGIPAVTAQGSKIVQYSFPAIALIKTYLFFTQWQKMKAVQKGFAATRVFPKK